MSKRSSADMSTKELRATRGAIRKAHGVIIGIFAVIILGWLILGYWRESPLVFVTTLVMFGGVTVVLLASRNGYAQELAKRQSADAAHRDAP